MSRTGDQQASNAIVSGVSFYAGALQRAHEETAHYERLVRVLGEEKKAQDEFVAELIAERTAAQNEVVELRGVVETLRKELQDERASVATERRRCNDLSLQKSEVESKYAMLHKENERLQRVNIESHNERDKNVKSLREASEALGWFKGEAHRFIKELGEILKAKGFEVKNGDDVLKAVRVLTSIIPEGTKVDVDYSDPNAPVIRTRPLLGR